MLLYPLFSFMKALFQAWRQRQDPSNKPIAKRQRPQSNNPHQTLYNPAPNLVPMFDFNHTPQGILISHIKPHTMSTQTSHQNYSTAITHLKAMLRTLALPLLLATVIILSCIVRIILLRMYAGHNILDPNHPHLPSHSRNLGAIPTDSPPAYRLGLFDPPGYFPVPTEPDFDALQMDYDRHRTEMETARQRAEIMRRRVDIARRLARSTRRASNGVRGVRRASM
jgi:hypothetical protein